MTLPILLDGLPFSLTLLTILMAHEMGHYLTARYYNVDATLPFFLPAPTLIGTFGAFIRIRSAILSKRILFDIGVGGRSRDSRSADLPLLWACRCRRWCPASDRTGIWCSARP